MTCLRAEKRRKTLGGGNYVAPAVVLDFQERHDQAWEEQEDEAELLAKAIGPRHYVENELRERRQDTGGEQST